MSGSALADQDPPSALDPADSSDSGSDLAADDLRRDELLVATARRAAANIRATLPPGALPHPAGTPWLAGM